MQVPGARDVGVEFFTLSKSYNMPGWRIGFAVGNREIIAALARIKSYLDYGIFQPLQIAAIARAERPAALRRRDPRDLSRDAATCCATGSIARAGTCRKPEGHDVRLGGDSRRVQARWARSSSRSSCCATPRSRSRPASASAQYGDDYVRFALIENEHRTRQAIRGIKKALGAAPRPGRARGPRPADAGAGGSAPSRRADRLRDDRRRRGEAPARTPRRGRAPRGRADRARRHRRHRPRHAIAECSTTGIRLTRDALELIARPEHRRRDRADRRLRAGAALRAGRRARAARTW